MTLNRILEAGGGRRVLILCPGKARGDSGKEKLVEVEANLMDALPLAFPPRSPP